jgi:hypothetical protein
VAIRDRRLINLRESDLDLPVYRIYPLDRFEALVKTSQDALVWPTKWDDPFENFMLARTSFIDDVTKLKVPLSNLAGDWYGQCWSLHEETDAMWRIYSPDAVAKPGVKVRSTLRKLFENLERVGPKDWPQQFFVGKIEYATQAELTARMSSLTFSDVAAGGQGDGFATLLCVKREAFAHEAEVRLMFQDMEIATPHRPKLGAGGIFRYALNPNVIFEEVVLDPRLQPSEVATFTSRLSAAGCRLPIHQSDLYAAPQFLISLE